MNNIILFSLNDNVDYNILLKEFGDTNIQILNISDISELETKCSAVVMPGTIFGRVDCGIAAKYLKYFNKKDLSYSIYSKTGTAYGCIQPISSCLDISYKPSDIGNNTVINKLIYIPVASGSLHIKNDTVGFDAMHNMLHHIKMMYRNDNVIALPILSLSSDVHDHVIAARQMRLAYEVAVEPIDSMLKSDRNAFTQRLINTLK